MYSNGSRIKDDHVTLTRECFELARNVARMHFGLHLLLTHNLIINKLSGLRIYESLSIKKKIAKKIAEYLFDKIFKA